MAQYCSAFYIEHDTGQIVQNAQTAELNTAHIYRPVGFDASINTMMLYKNDKLAGRLGAGESLKLPLSSGINRYEIMEVGFSGLSSTAVIDIDNNDSTPKYLVVAYRHSFNSTEGIIVEVSKDSFLEYVIQDRKLQKAEE